MFVLVEFVSKRSLLHRDREMMFFRAAALAAPEILRQSPSTDLKRKVSCNCAKMLSGINVSFPLHRCETLFCLDYKTAKLNKKHSSQIVSLYCEATISMVRAFYFAFACLFVCFSRHTMRHCERSWVDTYEAETSVTEHSK